MPQPIPFEIIEQDGQRYASNGTMRVAVFDADAKLYRKRAISGIPMKPPAEVLIPQLNLFAGELLANPGTPADVAVGRLLALAGLVPTAEPQRQEWIAVDIDGIHIYSDGSTVIVTRQELSP